MFFVKIVLERRQTPGFPAAPAKSKHADLNRKTGMPAGGNAGTLDRIQILNLINRSILQI